MSRRLALAVGDDREAALTHLERGAMKPVERDQALRELAHRLRPLLVRLVRAGSQISSILPSRAKPGLLWSFTRPFRGPG